MKILRLLTLFFIATSAHAYDNSSYYHIVHLYSWTSGDVHVWLKESAAAHQCSDNTYPTRYLMKRSSAEEFDQKFSLLLAAKTSDEPIKLRYECGNDGLPYIQAIRF